jgi:hypothetical protein
MEWVFFFVIAILLCGAGIVFHALKILLVLALIALILSAITGFGNRHYH